MKFIEEFRVELSAKFVSVRFDSIIDFLEEWQGETLNF